MSYKRHQCKILSVNPQRGNIIIVKCKYPEETVFNYRSGQYIKIYINDDIQLAYSVANAPNKEYFEIHIKNTQGYGVSRLLSNCNPGERIQVMGPYGHCTLDNTTEPLLFLAVGSGFSQVKSLVEEVCKQSDNRTVHLFWAGKDIKDLYLHDLAMSWQQNRLNINYHPITAVDYKTHNFSSGDIFDVVRNKCENLFKYIIYISGSKSMVETTYEKLLQQEVNQHAIYSDMLPTTVTTSR